MLKLIFFVIVLIFLSKAANPGVKIGVNQKALDYAAKIAVEIMAKEIPRIRIPNISGRKFLKYEVKNFRISSFTKPTASIKINPGSGLTIKLNNGGLRVDARWGIKLFFFWMRGGIYASASDINLDLGVGISAVSGRPRLSAKSCNARLGNFKVRTSGSILSWLINIIASLFNNRIRKLVEKEVCKSLTKVVNNNANNELATFNLVAKINNNIQIDYHLTDHPNFYSTYFDTSHKGKFLFDPVSVFSPAPMSLAFGRMVSTSISEDTLNSLGRVLHARKLFDYRFTVTDKIFEKLVKNMDIKDFKLNMHVYSTSALSVTITNSKLTVKVAVDAEFAAPNLILRLGVGVEATCTVKVEGDKIKGKVRGVKLDVVVKYNGIGVDIDNGELNDIAKALLPFLLPTINKKLNDGIPLPKIKHVTLSRYQLTLSYRHILIGYDIKKADWTPTFTKKKNCTVLYRCLKRCF